jgi:cell division protein FtsA
MDLARGLSTGREHAERLKVMHGSALPAGDDDRDTVTIQPIGPDDGDMPQHAPRSVMNKIIRARIEETLEIVRDRLNKSGFGGVVGKRVVLTGGASQMAGLPEAARRILARNVRLGRPLGVTGLPEAAKGPAFATTVGLLIYPQVAGFESRLGRGGAMRLRATGTGGRLQRVSQWFRDSF